MLRLSEAFFLYHCQTIREYALCKSLCMAKSKQNKAKILEAQTNALLDELIAIVGREETNLYIHQRIKSLNNGLSVLTPNEIFVVICEFFRVRTVDVKAKEDYTPNKRKAIRTASYVMYVWFNYGLILIASIIDRDKSQVSRYIQEVYQLNKKTPAEARWLEEIEDLRNYYRMKVIFSKHEKGLQQPESHKKIHIEK